MNYSQFFQQVTGNQPFPYQQRLGEAPWPTVLDIPTGLGKTAAITVAWLFKRFTGDPSAPRRLVYCLPMRVVVEQTRDAASSWCEAAAPAFEARHAQCPAVHVLMGGDLDDSWDSRPEHPAILIGTQDMLLSRALNRGYAMSRYRWPIHFALLNDDCLWVFDETQLVGVGIETSAQLQAFRHRSGSEHTTRTLWMSATVGADQLATVDHSRPEAGWATLSLSTEDASHRLVAQRTSARKPIDQAADLRLDKAAAKVGYAQALATRVQEEHARRGGLTLVILNRVARAQAVYAALKKLDGRTEDNTALVHSRFRRTDRARHEAVLTAGDRARIVVATQAVEAGVDVSARTMFTELAPWPSLVQRFGRCNRYGDEDAAILWLDIDAESDKGELALPYDPAELNRARTLLEELAATAGDAAPQHLREVPYAPPSIVRPVLRHRDLLDLFDTSPDLSGYDIDVSRYVRDGEDTDVQLFWRVFDDDPLPDMPRPSRDELCRVPVMAARKFLGSLQKQHQKLWRWDPLHRRWSAVDHVFAGQVLLAHADCGGYEPAIGWTARTKQKTAVPEVPGETAVDMAADEAIDGDPRSHLGVWVRLHDHLAHVRHEAAALATDLGLNDDLVATLSLAGLWHDVGKAHPVFQAKLLDPVVDEPARQPPDEGPWAKSSHRLSSKPRRKLFRHELASALAWLEAGDAEQPRTRDLVAYLVAAHHGKVRMSIRSLPDETRPDDGGRLFACGVWHGDRLPALKMPDGKQVESMQLDLSLMSLGEGSWLERTLALRDAPDLGPFRLALLETVVRIADWRASRKEQEGVHADS